MNGERLPHRVQRYRDELLRLASAESTAASASPELRNLLAADAELRAEFAETRELLHELRGVLRPEPLPDALVRRIHQQLDAQLVGRRSLALRHLRVAGLAAAAALLLTVIGPWNLPGTTSQTPPTITLSEQDAADIVAAWGQMSWGSYLDYSLERISDELDDIDQRIDRQLGVQTCLPWDPEDDWDLSTHDRGTAVPRPAPPVCCAQQADTDEHAWSCRGGQCVRTPAARTGTQARFPAGDLAG